MKKFLIAAPVLAGLIAAPAIAHHSFAMFDRDKEVTLVGTVKEFQWTNPHIFVQVVVPNKKGKAATEWSVEGASLNTVKRWGWKKDMIKPGDKVVVKIHPMRDGSLGGSLINIKLPNGRTFG